MTRIYPAVGTGRKGGKISHNKADEGGERCLGFIFIAGRYGTNYSAGFGDWSGSVAVRATLCGALD